MTLHDPSPPTPTNPAKPEAPTTKVQPATSASAAGGLPRLLFVADVKGWAFDNIAVNIARALAADYAADIVYERDFDGDTAALYHYIFFEHQADHVHFLWRGTALRWVFAAATWQGMLARYGVTPEAFAETVSCTSTTVGIYDHLQSEPAEIARVRSKLGLLDGVSASSARLKRLYDACGVPVAAVLSDGVDLGLFRPRRLSRLLETGRPLVVGWVGNSAWNHRPEHDRKGFLSITKPAVEGLIADGVPVVGHYADRAARWIPRADMPAYYGDIDVLICSSESEGTPNPVLEAMACGVAVISTDVGIVREALGTKQQAFILGERSTEALREAILTLVQQRHRLAELSRENLERIRGWSWQDKGPSWRRFLAGARASRRLHQARDRAGILELLSLNNGLVEMRNRLEQLEARTRTQKARIQALRAQRDHYRARAQTRERDCRRPLRLALTALRGLARRLRRAAVIGATWLRRR